MNNYNTENNDWTIFHNVRNILFPIYNIPIKCLIGSETMIGEDNQKYIYWTSVDGKLELIRLHDESPVNILSEDIFHEKKRTNLYTYIPSFVILNKEDGTPFIVWDHEASNADIEKLFTTPGDDTQKELNMAEKVQYLPIAFNAYMLDDNTKHIELLDISKTHKGEVNKIMHLTEVDNILHHLRNSIYEKSLTFNKDDGTLKFSYKINGAKTNYQDNIVIPIPNKIETNNIKTIHFSLFDGDSNFKKMIINLFNETS